MMNFNKTTISAFAAVALAGTSLVYAQFQLVNGGGGFGYGYGYGAGYGTDGGVNSRRLDGGPANQFLFGYGSVDNVNSTTGSGGGGGGGIVSGGGGGYYNPGTGTNVVTTTGGTVLNLSFGQTRVGGRGDFVKNLQAFLIKNEGAKFNVTGYFGPATKAAVIKFQRKYGIKPAIGIVGPKTVAKLNSLAK